MRRYRFWVWALLALHVAVLVGVAWGLPIGPHEAKLFFAGDTPVAHLMHLGKALFPTADFFNIRAPFLAIHMVNLYLFYRLSDEVLHDPKGVALSFAIFLLLPGIVSSAVLATSTGLILLLYQSFLILYLRHRRYAAYFLLPLFLWVDKSCVVLYFALLTYALWRREVGLVAITALLLGAGIGVYGIDMHGKPVNYFLDTVALYAAIFSPLLFLYFFYAIYRILLKGEKGIIWHVAFTVLLLSLLLSLRQRIPIEDFAPYVIVAIPLMVRLFLASYRVRLPQFRTAYRVGAGLVIGVLALNTLVLLFHRPFFVWLQRPTRHFAAPFYLPYWCAEALKERGITAIRVPQRRWRAQLRYYGIGDSDRIALEHRPEKGSESVTIRYNGRKIETCYVSKIYKNEKNGETLPTKKGSLKK